MFSFRKRKKKTVPDLGYPMRSCQEFLSYMVAGSYVPEDELVSDIMALSGYKVRVDILDLVRTTRNELVKV